MFIGLIIVFGFGLGVRGHGNVCRNFLPLLFALTTVHAAVSGPFIDSTPLGLPRQDHCAFAYNSSLYIFGGHPMSDNIVLKFDNDRWEPTVTHLETAGQAPNLTDIAGGGGCVVTSYGQAIFMPSAQQSVVNTLDLTTRQWAFIDSLLLSKNVLQRGMAMWNDMLFVLVNQGNGSSNTYVLDARIRTHWTWYEAQTTSDDAPNITATSSFTMIGTSRWILYFGTTRSGGGAHGSWQSSVAVHCFDPYLLLWVGKIAEFATSTDQVQVAMLGNDPTSDETESVLIVPSYSSSSSSSGRIAMVPLQGLWRLDLSRQFPRANVSWIPRSRIGPFRPLQGSSVTRLTNDTVVFYGGLPFTHDSFRVWNSTQSAFLSLPWWSSTSWYPDRTVMPSSAGLEDGNPESDRHKLAIIVGTVLGFIALVALVALGSCFCKERRRRRNHREPSQQQPSRSMSSICTPFRRQQVSELPLAHHQQQGDNAATWADQLRRALSAIARSGSSLRTASPVTSAPLEGGPPTSTVPLRNDSSASSITSIREKQIREYSRFHEHFDLLVPSSSIHAESNSTTGA